MSTPVAAAEPAPQASIFYKTSLCKFYKAGRCRRSSSCWFAHGDAELRPLPNLRNTKLCPVLRCNGVCCNPTCGFAHSRDELKKCVLRYQSQHRASPQFELRSASAVTRQDLFPSSLLRDCPGTVDTPVAQVAHEVEMTCNLLRQLTPSTDSAKSERSSFFIKYTSGETIQNTSNNDEIDSYSQHEMGVSSESLAYAQHFQMYFDRTNICRHFKLGGCRRGARCRFAHFEEELHSV